MSKPLYYQGGRGVLGLSTEGGTVLVLVTGHYRAALSPGNGLVSPGHVSPGQPENGIVSPGHVSPG
jgi:hypothetical protein